MGGGILAYHLPSGEVADDAPELGKVGVGLGYEVKAMLVVVVVVPDDVEVGAELLHGVGAEPTTPKEVYHGRPSREGECKLSELTQPPAFLPLKR